jgi:hypothetical protein
MIKRYYTWLGYTQNDFCEWGSDYGPSLKDFWHNWVVVEYTDGSKEYHCTNCDWAGLD